MPFGDVSGRIEPAPVKLDFRHDLRPLLRTYRKVCLWQRRRFR